MQGRPALSVTRPGGYGRYSRKCCALPAQTFVCHWLTSRNMVSIEIPYELLRYLTLNEIAVTIPGKRLALRIIAPPRSVEAVGIAPRSKTPKTMPHTGSRLANRLDRKSTRLNSSHVSISYA